MNLFEKWKEFVVNMNEKGVPIPTLRDPKTKLGSVSFTMTVISFNLCMAGIIGKWSGALGGVDPSQALQLFMVCAGLYWGRKLSSNKAGKVTVDKDEKP